MTGGAGFIGSNFCNLNSEKFEIVALDNLFLGDEKNLQKNTKFIFGDAAKMADLKKCGQKFDVILHLAGTSSAPMFENFFAAYKNSIDSFLRVLEFSKICGARKILFASTSSIYGNQKLPLHENKKIFPTNHYSVSKIFYENCGECFQKINPKIEVIGFRFMSVYGPNEEKKGRFANLISQFLWDFARGRSPIIFGDGSQTRDFTNVADIISAINLAIETKKKLGFEIFNIGTGQNSSINEMIEILQKNLPTKIAPKFIENPVRENYIAAQCADISKIQKILNFAPKISLENGIKNQIANLRPEKILETSSDFF